MSEIRRELRLEREDRVIRNVGLDRMVAAQVIDDHGEVLDRESSRAIMGVKEDHRAWTAKIDT